MKRNGITWCRAVIPSALEQLMISGTSSPFLPLVSLASSSISLASSVSSLAQAARNSAALSNLTLFLKTDNHWMKSLDEGLELN